MAGFGLPNLSQLTEAFRKAQQIQKDAVKLQEELDALVLEGFSEDRRVRVTISGNQVPQGVFLDPGLLNEEPQVVEAAVLEALQAAHLSSTETMKARMEELTGSFGNLNMPNLLGG
ncbi:nucleoid-associated protein, YbaB/EbfC family [Candidatus Synechococcus spongiarum LMB bulk10E]|uniref:Nucleoid-associated protein, YbaB/EbfC family n=3 Tax=Candidatus Synechococcus spongiarum TaxID=431041 RepID=A0A1T1D1A4_9SYNE|nr:YbaB/EbfC family nucleoid-associated protein [Candidatus Synechococcus spongiarum]KKZ10250.1 MAG: nucleoid-associated protein [Candidatus Synechococcus spongiarum 15L]OOV34632.1 nucleoid-associated protein, YbaB/EbfC family [Candidatus Synechococcus spongiarum LMB bulk15M]OOV34824.1 nucleoid-associated protein, YbaB/EbfC family [Candidatus Synechococcus spongiarum LMB bulk15N]OOV35365.1 nucleoid-associated protein, YbaB/EbfC family [Candidatus Synechococcus spongiarum LMB bulk10E]